MAAAVIPKVVFLALGQFCWSFVPCYDGVVKGHLTLKGGGLVLTHHNVLDALRKLNWLGCLKRERVQILQERKKALSLCFVLRYLKISHFYLTIK